MPRVLQRQTGDITAHLLPLLVHAVHVAAADDVPHVDVLVHAARHAGILLGGEGRAGGGNTGIEAVLVDFLVPKVLAYA